MGVSHALIRRFPLLFAVALSLSLFSGTVTADVPWPPPGGQQNPYSYEEYCFSAERPDDFNESKGDFWQLTGDKSSHWYFSLIKALNPRLYRKELEGVMGSSVDRAWGYTTGRPDVLIAELDSGILWRDRDSMKELRRKVHVNTGELPAAKGYSPGSGAAYDVNGDGVFNVEDYEAAGDFGARIGDVNGNGLLDGQDLIWTFSDGVDDDANGYTDDISGWDFYEDDNDPWDECDFGHGTAECRWSAAEAGNSEDFEGEEGDSANFVGTCPNAMLLPVRVGDSFIVDVNDFAQGVIFGVDSGAWVIQEALGAVNHTSFGQAAIDYAWSKGVAVVAAAADEESAHQNYPCSYARTIQVNSVRKYFDIGTELLNQWPPSFLYLGNITNYGVHTVISSTSDGHSSGATGNAAGIAGLVYSAAMNQVRKGRLARYPGLETPLSACEVKQLLAMTADDIDFSPNYYNTSFGLLGIPLLDQIIGASERFHSTPGWDPYFGYGRVNALSAVKAVSDGRIPPEAEILSPAWFEPIDPEKTGMIEIRARVRAVRVFSDSKRDNDFFHYTVEWAPGWNPGKNDWHPLDVRFNVREPERNVTARVSADTVAREVLETVEQRGGPDDPNRYTFTVRVRVYDSGGNAGEDRRACFCYNDPDANPGTPLKVAVGAPVGMAAPPRFADLDDDGEQELLVANDDGEIHAYNSDFSEVPGWPVYANALGLHTGSAAFRTGGVGATARGTFLGAPAVGDLDRDGTLEVVAGDGEGRMYAWDRHGRLLPGFPVRSNPLYSIPDRADWWTPGALPTDWYQNRVVPDRKHRLDRYNCLEKAFLRGPVLADLDSPPDGRLEIIAACLDQHVYAWRLDGTPAPGWPVKLVDPAKVVSFDPVTHTCGFQGGKDEPLRGSKIATAPSVADLDGDGDVEVVCGTNEGYVEEPNASNRTFGLKRYLDLLGLLGVELRRQVGLSPGNTRVYALHHDGVLYGAGPSGTPADQVPANAYLDGWPVRLTIIAPGMLPNVFEGVNGPAALADIDGDGKVEIGVSSCAGPGYLLRHDGSSYLGTDSTSARLPLTLSTDTVGSKAGSRDAPAICALGGGCFVEFPGEGMCYASPGFGIGRGIDLAFPAEQKKSDDQLSVWRTADGRFLDAYPRKVNDMMFFVTPGAADIDGDGSQEILAGSSYYDVHAFKADGTEAEGWPKITGGWNVATPPVADFDGGGKREVVMTTREGWLFAWRTRSRADHGADWPEWGHDPWSTGYAGTDARRPGRVMDLKASLVGAENDPDAIRLTWTAPGDDECVGRAGSYDIRFSDAPIDGAGWKTADRIGGGPKPGKSGRAEEMFIGIPARAGEGRRVLYFALQAKDDAGNVSAISNVASVSFGGEPTPTPAPRPEEKAATRWLLAEGSTGSDDTGHFETWVLLANPGEEKATARVTYMTDRGAVKGPTVELEPGTRTSLDVGEIVPGTWSVSTEVVSDRPVTAERTTYWNTPSDKRVTAHSSIGSTEPAGAWLLAEGSTGSDDTGHFETWVLVQNPGDRPAEVRLTYLTPSGTVAGPSFTLKPKSRRSVGVSDLAPGQWSVSTLVKADRGVVAERAVYWCSPSGERRSAHGGVGAR